MTTTAPARGPSPAGPGPARPRPVPADAGADPVGAGRPGTPLARLEGPAKVTGTARYGVEHPVDDALHAWVVQSPIARGAVRAVSPPAVGTPDAAGVVAVLWHGNAPRLAEAEDPELAVLQSDRIAYRGQVVALVVAETLEAARRGAQAVQLDLHEEEHDTVLRTDHPGLYTPEKINPAFPSDTAVGDVDTALAEAPVVLDATYSTPAVHNAPMEPHATTAVWEAATGTFTLYDSTQHASGVAASVAGLFGLEPADVRVLNPHVGGGFGSKGSARPNAVLAAMAARELGRPVKLALPRQATFTMVGHRTPTISRLQLGATADGVLTAIAHDVVEQSSTLFEFAEQTALATRSMYAAPHRRTSHRLLRLDVPTPRWMRAPGEAPGMYALECAVDELAARLELDPIELRVRNEPDVEPESGKPFTSRRYLDCLREGAERFGWAGRDHRPRRTRDGEWWIGTGVGGASYPSHVMPSTARVRATPDGRFAVALAAADIGTGARTVLTQIAAGALDVEAGRVEVVLGDSALPTASVAGGSAGTASWGWAVVRACEGVLRQVAAHDGVVPEAGLETSYDTAEEVEALETEGKHSFGAHFAQVRVSAVTGEVRVDRLLGVYAAGRILNPRTARSQLIGGMTMGIGMALHEEAVLDPATGDWVNHDLAEYHVPANADVRDVEAVWLEEEDPELNPTRTKGIGEIGIVGSPAAIANAVWHATGVRVRDLPVRLDKVLAGLEADRG